MKANEFRLWLLGFLFGKDELSEDDMTILKDVLEKVEDNTEFHIVPNGPQLDRTPDHLRPAYIVECEKVTNGCPEGCVFPAVWHGVYPPTCKKCGKQVGQGLGFKYNTNVTG